MRIDVSAVPPKPGKLKIGGALMNFSRSFQAWKTEKLVSESLSSSTMADDSDDNETPQNPFTDDKSIEELAKLDVTTGSILTVDLIVSPVLTNIPGLGVKLSS